MTIIVAPGVYSGFLTISSGDPLVALSGGQVESSTILSGGSATLLAGAAAVQLTVSKGGVLIGPGELYGSDSVAGALIGVTIGDQANDYNTIELQSGGTANGVILADVLSASQTSDGNVTIFGRQTFEVDHGASATGTFVSGGSYLDDLGSAALTVIASGGEEIVSSGAVASGATVQAGGTFGLFGGAVTGATVQSGGTLAFGENLTSDFIATSSPVTRTTVMSGATVSSGGWLDLVSATVLSGVMVRLASGAVAESLTVSKGGVLLGPGELDGNATVAGSLRGVTIGDQVNDYNTAELLSGATASGVVLANVLSVGPGDDNEGIVVGSQTLKVDRGASAEDTLVLAGSFLDDFGSSVGTIVAIDGEEAVYAGGVASGDTIGGIEIVFGGTVSSATVQAGATFEQSGGTAAGVTVQSGGVDYLGGGAATGLTLQAGGKDYVFDSGTDTGTAVLSGGGEYVLSGGAATGAVVSNGGLLRVAYDGKAAGAVVEAGGVETLFAGGVASWNVLSGGIQYDYGRASNTVIRSGGREMVEAGGGTVSASVISSGGREVVSSGGIAEATTVSVGGALLVVSGGQVTSGLTLEGGVVAISGTMTAGQVVHFTGASAELQLDNLAGFHAEIWGLNTSSKTIDLGGFAYSSGTEKVSWTQSGTSGTLKVTGGAKVASLTLIGTYTSGDFNLANDGHGGTFVYDPPAIPATAPAANHFAQALAGFSGREQGFAAIHAGGTASMSASPLVTAATSGR
jgi:autotransporter passenger strand-loop-strand repeat protein